MNNFSPYLYQNSLEMRSIIIFFSCLGIVAGFQVFWNAPTGQCSRNYRMDFVNLLKTYGIQVNSEDNFHGDKVTIFYDAQLGLYPKLENVSGEMIMINGGLPQKGDVISHLNKAAKDLKKIIPSEDFDGLGVIDWESWRPIWDFNFDSLRIYQTKSIELAKEENPTADAKTITKIAMTDWENGAKSYMLKTLQMSKKLRPKAVWGYYLFPDCYNHKGKTPEDFKCSESIRKGNDKLSWLWEDSTAVFPSIYFYRQSLDAYTLEERSWRDNEKLREALRVASPKAKIFPYVNYHSQTLIPEKEMRRQFAQSAAVGSDGAVVWGASASVSSEKMCKDLKNYIIDTLGPAAEKVAWRSNLCSKQICHNRGRCTFPKDDNATAWKLFLDDSVKTFYAGDITCRCSENYSGRYCEKSL